MIYIEKCSVKRSTWCEITKLTRDRYLHLNNCFQEFRDAFPRIEYLEKYLCQVFKLSCSTNFAERHGKFEIGLTQKLRPLGDRMISFLDRLSGIRYGYLHEIIESAVRRWIRSFIKANAVS